MKEFRDLKAVMLFRRIPALAADITKACRRFGFTFEMKVTNPRTGDYWVANMSGTHFHRESERIVLEVNRPTEETE